jgi:hypothetical protein
MKLCVCNTHNTKFVFVSEETKKKLIVQSFLDITLARKATSIAEIWILFKS